MTPPLQGRRDVAALGLGYSYETGRRVAVSLPKAVELYEAAARAGTGGLDSPGGGDVSIELLMTVTNREIAAGRMTEDHSMRQIAVEGAAAPHFSHAELLAKHAKLKEATEKSKAAPAPKTVGEKLKGLFRRN